MDEGGETRARERFHVSYRPRIAIRAQVIISLESRRCIARHPGGKAEGRNAGNWTRDDGGERCQFSNPQFRSHAPAQESENLPLEKGKFLSVQREMTRNSREKVASRLLPASRPQKTGRAFNFGHAGKHANTHCLSTSVIALSMTSGMLRVG